MMMQCGDIVIGKCAESGADHSIRLKHTKRGMVQKVVLAANDGGKNFAVVSLRQGFLESQENFPLTMQGIVPDIVINPHAFPSRQTPGQLLEAALGKGIACGGSGTMKCATPFSTVSVETRFIKLTCPFNVGCASHPISVQFMQTSYILFNPIPIHEEGLLVSFCSNFFYALIQL